MSLLTGPKILEEVETGRVHVFPFAAGNVGPNSVDLTLGPVLRAHDVSACMDPKNPPKTSPVAKVEHPVTGELVWDLVPGILYLGSTVEEAGSDFYVPRIEGRSSLGRLGIEVHKTAGFGDVGFKCVWTLEIEVTQWAYLYPGMRICQVYFETLEGRRRLYEGKYADSPRDGPTPSRAHMDREWRVR